MTELLTGEKIHAAWMQVFAPDLDMTWTAISKEDRARYTAMAALLNTGIFTDGAAERDALRSRISQLQAQIDELTETVLRTEQERDAFQQLAGAMGRQERGHE